MKPFYNIIVTYLLIPFIKSDQSPYCPLTSSSNLECDPNTYESFDGTCNNLNNPLIGSINSPFKRYIQPDYLDGKSAPRNGPNPRLTSRTLLFDQSNEDKYFTHLCALFGQYIAFDLTHAHLNSNTECPCDSSNSDSCLSFQIPPGDTALTQTCFKFIRSTPSNQSSSSSCSTGYREQFNKLSAYLDLSQTFGTNQVTNNNLRLFQNGFLNTSNGIQTNRAYLPLVKCNGNSKCFKAGEQRTNENMGLTSVYTLFLREHNRIATQLASLNPDWNDSKLFFETRHILIGIYQHVLYNEWLPIVIGQTNYIKEDLKPISTYFKGYNSNINPSIVNEFATAAFRFGHVTIRNWYSRYTPSNLKFDELLLSNIMLITDAAFKALGLESIMAGLFNDNLYKFGPQIADSLQNHLFQVKNADGTTTSPQDLASLNINRGRDHGLPVYVSFRSFCNLPPVESFNDLKSLMTDESINKLRLVYKDVKHIDLWVGGVFEKPIDEQSIVGPTFSCIISKQFKDLKYGDRFFYENEPNLEMNTLQTAFTFDQLNELKKIKMSTLICNNFEVNSIQPNVFFEENVPFFNNQRVDCASLEQIDLAKWSTSELFLFLKYKSFYLPL